MAVPEILEHGNAREVVAERLVEEIVAAVQQAEDGTPKEVHASIQEGLRAMGWEIEAPVAPGLNHRFDALKERVAVEVEFGLMESAFKEWAKFQKAHVEGTAVAGVHIVPGRPTDVANCSAGWVARTLGDFGDVFCVPILIVGIDLLGPATPLAQGDDGNDD